MHRVLSVLSLAILFACGGDGDLSGENEGTRSSGVSSNPNSASVYVTNTAFQTSLRGPDASKGVVIYFGGVTDGRPTPMNDTIVPPYMTYLNKRGWDVLRANPPIAMRHNNLHSQLAQNMNLLANEVRFQGYKRVVFAGQSFGAYGMMTATANAAFDKFIAMAPASGGSVEQRKPRKPALMGQIRPFAAASKAPGVIFLFENDDFYRVATQDQIAAGGYRLVDVEDRPAGFNGHGASWLDAFEFVYGECLNKYIQNNSKEFRCAKPSLSPQDHRWMTNADHLRSGGAKPVSAAEAIATWTGNTVAGRADGEIVNLYFPSQSRIVLEFRSGFDLGKVEKARFSFSEDKFCSDNPFFRGACYSLYKWPSENLFFAVTEEGNIVFRGQLLKGNPRGLR